MTVCPHIFSITFSHSENASGNYWPLSIYNGERINTVTYVDDTVLMVEDVVNPLTITDQVVEISEERGHAENINVKI